MKNIGIVMLLCSSIILFMKSFTATFNIEKDFITTEFVLELNECINDTIKNIDYTENTIYISYENGTNVSYYIGGNIFLFEQELIVVSSKEFLNEQLQEIVTIAMEVPYNIEQIIASIKETGEGKIPIQEISDYFYKVILMEDTLTITLCKGDINESK